MNENETALRTVSSLIGDEQATVTKTFTIPGVMKDGKDVEYERSFVADISLRALVKSYMQYVIVRLIQDRVRVLKEDKTDTITRKKTWREALVALFAERQKVVPVSLVFKVFGKDPEEVGTRTRKAKKDEVQKLTEKLLSEKTTKDEKKALKTALVALLASIEDEDEGEDK